MRRLLMAGVEPVSGELVNGTFSMWSGRGNVGVRRRQLLGLRPGKDGYTPLPTGCSGRITRLKSENNEPDPKIKPRFRSCALVGNGGTIRRAHYGEFIDRHDAWFASTWRP
mmetsp:Transcript_28869/g.63218  ORF Transcript_28869/g.63218 Transcript_28869/m.63218 type:complete len:111 (+) Transcript_28869:363-695(+)